MAENIVVVMNKDDLQPLANDIKTLNGLSQSDLVTLNEMEKAIEDANDAVDSQENLIAQISAALEGKAAGGGGSGGAVETCTVTVRGYSSNYCPNRIWCSVVNDEGKIEQREMYNDERSANFTINNCVCGTYVVVNWVDEYYNGEFTTTNARGVWWVYGSAGCTIFEITAGSGETADIYNYYVSSGGEPSPF